MNPDEMFLRYRLRQWHRRFRDDLSLSINVMIVTKRQFALTYGFEELARIDREVALEVAEEMSHECMSTLRGSEGPVLSNVWRVRVHHPPRRKERRGRRVQRWSGANGAIG